LDLFVRDLLYNVETQVTSVGMGIAYDAAWSPDGMHIAFASDQDGDDEIFVVERDGAPTEQLTQNMWEWDKHPSFSPDGQRIVYASNAGTGRMQIWVMNADGSDKHNISSNAYSEWDPVWVK
jgi:Tol biopolymer transport system component